MVKLEKKDIDRAAMTLTRSFWNDAFMIFLSPDEAQREKIAQGFFKFMLRYVLTYGEAYATSPNFEGVALWLPSQYAKMTTELIAPAGWQELSVQLGDECIGRLLLVNEPVDLKHEYHITNPHWYLAYIGIDPDFQGKGFANKLIRPMLGRFAVEAIPCYLETNTAKNVPLYEHYGFRLLEEFAVPQAGITFYAMLRK